MSWLANYNYRKKFTVSDSLEGDAQIATSKQIFQTLVTPFGKSIDINSLQKLGDRFDDVGHY